MTTRQFDPVLSAALRNELEALADASQETARPPSAVRVLLHRPQVWVTAATAILLVVATLGILHLDVRPAVAPAGRSSISDPLAQITDRASADYVGDAPRVLLRTSGIGAATQSIDVPAGVTSVRPYIRCEPLASFRITVGKGFSTGCDARSADFADIPVTTGTHQVSVRIPAGVAWKLLVIATPDDSTTTDSTLRVTTGPDVITDPLSEITDPTSTLFVADTVVPIIHQRGTGSHRFSLDVPSGVTSIRFYVVCASGATWSLDGTSSTCRGHINGYSDEPTSQVKPSAMLTLPAGTRFWLLVIPTPTTTSSVDWNVGTGLLPYPTDAVGTGENLVGRARSSTTKRVDGTMTAAVRTLRVVTTCQGNGTLVVSTSDGSVVGAASQSPNTDVCRSGSPRQSGYRISAQGGLAHDGPLRYSVQPVGSVSWTISFFDER